uniref:Uncharacterized protein n=1 Tax=Citrus limon TaxID=2708 RepID=A0A1S8ACW7_CITLI
MDLVMGSSSFKQPLLHFPSSSSSFYSQSSLLLCTNNARTKRRNRLSAMASMRPGDPKDNIFIRRKTILLVGISVLPLLNLRARALDGLAPSERGRWNLWGLVSGRGCLHELAAKKLCLCSAPLSYLVDQQAMFLG